MIPPRQNAPERDCAKGSVGRRRRGQSEVVSTVLVLGVTAVAVSGVLVFGAATLSETQSFVELGAATNGIETLDAGVSNVALGDSPAQEVRLSGAASGSYRVDPDSGVLTVVHDNYDGSGSREQLARVRLGTVAYEAGEETVALQGGGVWRRSGSDVTMVSPPAVHYREATLTMPVINVTSRDAAGGAVTAAIEPDGEPRRQFPNASSAYGPNKPYANPTQNGTVLVKVQSQYYQGWATFFETRTDGRVRTYESNRTAVLELESLGTTGDFEMPADGDSVSFRLADGHPISEFSLDLFDEGSNEANYNNLQWSLYAQSGSRQLEFHFRPVSGGGGMCGNDIRLTVYYSENGGTTYESWYDPSAFTVDCGDFDGDGEDERRIAANLTQSDSIQYQSLDGQTKIRQFAGDAGSFESSSTFDEHAGTVASEPSTTSTARSLHDVTNHYLSLFGPRVTLVVDDKPGSTVDESTSSGHIDADHGSGQILQFLHITENRVEVELE